MASIPACLYTPTGFAVQGTIVFATEGSPTELAEAMQKFNNNGREKVIAVLAVSFRYNCHGYTFSIAWGGDTVLIDALPEEYWKGGGFVPSDSTEANVVLCNGHTHSVFVEQWPIVIFKNGYYRTISEASYR